jgi:hypothetical protein
MSIELIESLTALFHDNEARETNSFTYPDAVWMFFSDTHTYPDTPLPCGPVAQGVLLMILEQAFHAADRKGTITLLLPAEQEALFALDALRGMALASEKDYSPTGYCLRLFEGLRYEDRDVPTQVTAWLHPSFADALMATPNALELLARPQPLDSAEADSTD